MRNGQNKRMRGRNNNHSHGHSHSHNNNHRKSHNPMARVYESNGPDVKIRGTASHIAEKLVQTVDRKKRELETMRTMVYEGLEILSGNGDLTEFGKLMDESWKIKRELADNISSSQIDQIYSEALKAGASGGKLLGAGGGGFLLLFVRPDLQEKVRSRLKDFLHVPFQLENSGSQIFFYKPDYE